MHLLNYLYSQYKVIKMEFKSSVLELTIEQNFFFIGLIFHWLRIHENFLWNFSINNILETSSRSFKIENLVRRILKLILLTQLLTSYHIILTFNSSIYSFTNSYEASKPHGIFPLESFLKFPVQINRKQKLWILKLSY